MKSVLFALLAILAVSAFGDEAMHSVVNSYIASNATGSSYASLTKNQQNCIVPKAIYCAPNMPLHNEVQSSDHIKLASGCTDACKYNYNQCMQGCGGASSCSSQCQRNYDGCMSGC